jgi:beta-barrel assembly-enhancing protease
MSNYTATYYNAAGRFFPATIFLSTVTITIRFRDENNVQQDVNWLEKDIVAFEEQPAEAVVQYRNKQGAIERLIIRDMTLLTAIKKNLRHNPHFGQVHHRLFNSSVSKIIILAIIILGLPAAGYFWFVPWLGERAATGFSKEYEIKMGEQMYASIATSYSIDEKKTAAINAFYQQLHFKIDYPVKITVVHSKEINAFAIPGGHIVVYDAILKKIKTPEELAALLGHEGSHIALRHSLRTLFRSLARKMFLSLITGNESGIVNVVVDNADDLKGLQYSRSLETEADNSGLQLMSQNSIGLQGMVQLMETLNQEDGSEELPAFISTHPVFNDRIENIKEKISKLPATTTQDKELATLFQAIYAQW